MSAEVRRGRNPVGMLLRACGGLAAVGFIALLAYGLVTQSSDSTIDDNLAQARATAAPGFEVDVLQRGRQPARLRRTVDRAATDGHISLSELRGAPVVLNFWASWCDPCRVEAPVLERGWSQAGPQGVLFLGLDMQDVTDDAREFLREFRISYLNVREGGKETSRRYGGTGLPETYFISARGQVVGHVIGAMTAVQLRAGVGAARDGRPSEAREGGERQKTR
jgi:cytochrome c biogenesis protein CcmG, thiol:disulfide interchange protein DsbE